MTNPRKQANKVGFDLLHSTQSENIMAVSSLLQQRIRQFLVHSFLYYKLGESVISDAQYDQICQELQKLLAENQDPSIPYFKLVQSLGEEASGFSIKNYPPEIISAAMHLLFQAHYSDQISFEDFVVRHGYRFEIEEKTAPSNDGEKLT